MNEPEWIDHDGSAVCPVPAGHDVEVRFRAAGTSRDGCPDDWRWEFITHYRDWTAFEQQQASPEVPEWVERGALKAVEMALLTIEGADVLTPTGWAIVVNALEQAKGVLSARVTVAKGASDA